MTSLEHIVIVRRALEWLISITSCKKQTCYHTVLAYLLDRWAGSKPLGSLCRIAQSSRRLQRR